MMPNLLTRILAFACLFAAHTGGFSAFATASSCAAYLTSGPPAKSLSQHFQSLMNQQMLLQQMDVRLQSRDLVVPNGGLCSSTCGVNVVNAMVNYSSGQGIEFSQNAATYVESIVNHARDSFGTDARMGLDLSELASGLQLLSHQLGLKIRSEKIVPSFSRPLGWHGLSLAENELIIASVAITSRDGAQTYHAIVITSFDPQRGLVTYSDPNSPNSSHTVKVEPVFAKGGHRTLRVSLRLNQTASTYDGTIYDILRLKVPSPL